MDKKVLARVLVNIGEAYLEAAALAVLSDESEDGLTTTKVGEHAGFYNKRSNNWIVDSILHKLQDAGKVKDIGDKDRNKTEWILNKVSKI